MDSASKDFAPAIWVIDPSRTLRIAIPKLFLPGELRFSAAPDLASALLMLPHSSPHLILLDGALCTEESNEAFAALRRASSAPLILMLASFHDDEAQARCEDLGAAGFILKPFLSDELKQTIRDHLPLNEEVAPLPERSLAPSSDQLSHLFSEWLAKSPAVQSLIERTLNSAIREALPAAIERAVQQELARLLSDD